jgi:hypothetical protein
MSFCMRFQALGRYLWLSACALVLSACAQVQRTDDLVGWYVLRTDSATDVIRVDRDGAYRHGFYPHNGHSVQESGSWEFDQVDGQPVIVFHDFVDRASLAYFPDRPQIRGMWPAHVQRSIWGGLRLIEDDDAGWYYVWQRQTPKEAAKL